jgi:CMP-N-acetylneuraminic acid synthetase
MNAHISKIAALIPARKGSTRVQAKNISIVAGKPLVQWTFEAALKTRLTNIFFSTDYLPGELGFKMPNGIEWISRPKEFCTAEAKADGYIRHFFDRFPKFDVVILLQPTCPLRTSKDIENTLDMYLDSKKETLVSVYKIPQKQKLYKHNGASHFGPKILEHGSNWMYHRNSSIYIFSKKYFNKYNDIFESSPLMYEMPMMKSLDIDIQMDVIFAERMLKYMSGGENSAVDDFDIVNNSY